MSGLGGAAERERAVGLKAQASFTGAVEGVTGQGRAEIRDGQLHDLPRARRRGRRAGPPTPARPAVPGAGAIDFVLAGDVLADASRPRFVSDDHQRILGKGEVLLRNGHLAHEFTLLVPPAAVRQAPREMRTAFTDDLARQAR